MLASEGFRALLADCKAKAEAMSSQIVHTIPADEQGNREQFYWRGKVVAYEDFLGIAEDLKTFLEAQKETP